MRETPSKTHLSESLNDHVSSWVFIVVENILGDSVKEASDLSMLLPLLIDIIPHPVVVCKGDFSQALGLGCEDMFSLLLWILSFWRGRKVEMAYQLILERYVFLLCWGTLSSISSNVTCTLLSESTLTDLDLSNTESFFKFGLIALSDCCTIGKDVKMAEVILDLLQRLQVEQSSDWSVVKGWDFFRKGSWVSLVLSLLHTGIWKYSISHEVAGVEHDWVHHSKENQFFYVAEEMVSTILQGNNGGLLLNALSSFLKIYLQNFQEAFLSPVDHNRYYGSGLSPLLLLEYNRFDKDRQHFLLRKCGSSSLQLESLYDLLLKLDEVAATGDMGNWMRLL